MRFLTLAGVLLLLTVVFIPSSAFATKKHGCAPTAPPPVSGTLVQPPASRGILYINEVLLTPHSTWNCSEEGTFSALDDTWIEIYNTQNQPFDLYSVHTSIDSGLNTNPFYFPFGAAIAPHGYMVVFPRLDANFLETETQNLRLLIGGIPVDEVSVPTLGEDQSYARVPDGSSTWIITSEPTIDAANISSLLPPTPTLTPTRHRIEATATAHATSGNKKNNKGNQSGSGELNQSNQSNQPSQSNSTNNEGSGQQSSGGTQPQWSTLKNVNGSTATATPASNTVAGANTTLQMSNGGEDITRKFILTILICAFAATLFWCWQLFRSS